MRTILRCCLLALLALLAREAGAELFRCVGPDGEVVFTDQKDVCPGADAFEPSGVVHSAPTPARRPPASRDALAEDAREAEADSWRRRKREAEERLEALQKRREWMKPYVNHCNRGGYVTTRDDAGIEQVVNCSLLRRDFAALDPLEAELREYLDTGLAEECRKAGCLPGWLR